MRRFRLRQGYGVTGEYGRTPKAKNPTGKPAGFLLWRRPIDSLAPVRSPFGLPVYLAVPDRSILLRHAAFRRAALRVRRPHRNVKTPLGINRAGF